MYAPTASGVVPGPQRSKTMTTKQTTPNDLAARLAALSKRSTKELRAAYEKQHGRSPTGFSRTALIKALATAPTSAPPTKAATPKQAPPAPATPTTARKTGAHDPRLPAPGTVLERSFKGKVHKVTVRADAFEYAGKEYRSLTAAAKAATGYPSISGTLFWGIAKASAPRKAKKG